MFRVLPFIGVGLDACCMKHKGFRGSFSHVLAQLNTFCIRAKEVSDFSMQLAMDLLYQVQIISCDLFAFKCKLK